MALLMSNNMMEKLGESVLSQMVLSIIDQNNNNLVPFSTLFLFNFFLLLQYNILQDLSSLNFLRWDGSFLRWATCKVGFFPERRGGGGVPGGYQLSHAAPFWLLRG
jgi:hypothetical protein